MPLPRRPQDVTADHIRRLVDGRERESRSLDYKETYDFGGPEKQREKERAAVRKDIVALANAGGGYLVIGVTEEIDDEGTKTGFPKACVGVPDADTVRSTIRNVVQANIDPQIRFSTDLVEGFEKGPCILVHVPRSFRGPHMTTDNKQFPTRRDDSNGTMTVDELRAAFLDAGDVAARASEWLHERTNRNFSNEGVPSLMDGDATIMTSPRFYLHVGSVDAVVRGSVHALVEDAAVRDDAYLPFKRACTRHFNYDGVCFLDNQTLSQSWKNLLAFSVVHRVGWIEVARYLETAARHGLLLQSLFDDVVEQVARVLRRFIDLDIAPQYFVHLAFYGVRNLNVYGTPGKIDRLFLRLPLAILDDASIEENSKIEDNVGRALRPLFDQLAQASGGASAQLR